MNSFSVEKEKKNCMNIFLVEEERKIIIHRPKFFHSNHHSQCNFHKFFHCSEISSVILSVIFSVKFLSIPCILKCDGEKKWEAR